MAAKKKKCTVYSLDLNPIASKLCERNIAINKLAGEVISINGDASKIIEEQLIDKSDRTLTLLPERSDEFLDSAISTTKNGGIIHYYSHIHADKKSEAGKLTEEHYKKNYTSKIRNSWIKNCKSCRTKVLSNCCRC